MDMESLAQPGERPTFGPQPLDLGAVSLSQTLPPHRHSATLKMQADGLPVDAEHGRQLVHRLARQVPLNQPVDLSIGQPHNLLLAARVVLRDRFKLSGLDPLSHPDKRRQRVG